MQSVYEDMPKPQRSQLAEQASQKALEMQRLCYEIFFVNTDGKMLYENLVQEILLNTTIDMSKPQPEQAAIYLEGMRKVVKMLRDHAKAHKERINTQR